MPDAELAQMPATNDQHGDQRQCHGKLRTHFLRPTVSGRRGTERIQGGAGAASVSRRELTVVDLEVARHRSAGAESEQPWHPLATKVPEVPYGVVVEPAGETDAGRRLVQLREQPPVERRALELDQGPTEIVLGGLPAGVIGGQRVVSSPAKLGGQRLTHRLAVLSGKCLGSGRPSYQLGIQRGPSGLDPLEQPVDPVGRPGDPDSEQHDEYHRDDEPPHEARLVT